MQMNTSYMTCFGLCDCSFCCSSCLFIYTVRSLEGCRRFKCKATQNGVFAHCLQATACDNFDLLQAIDPWSCSVHFSWFYCFTFCFACHYVCNVLPCAERCSWTVLLVHVVLIQGQYNHQWQLFRIRFGWRNETGLVAFVLSFGRGCQTVMVYCFFAQLTMFLAHRFSLPSGHHWLDFRSCKRTCLTCLCMYAFLQLKHIFSPNNDSL